MSLVTDDDLGVVLDEYVDVTALLVAALPPIAPDPSVRARLLATVAASVQPGRFDAFAARVASMFDVTRDKARMFLGWIDDATQWGPSPLPGVQLAHLTVGATWAHADCGLVRIPAGYQFPWHTHDGDELTVVLQGRARYTDSTGAVVVVGPGDELLVPGDFVHAFVVDPGDEYVFAVRHQGLRPVPPPPV